MRIAHGDATEAGSLRRWTTGIVLTVAAAALVASLEARASTPAQDGATAGSGTMAASPVSDGDAEGAAETGEVGQADAATTALDLGPRSDIPLSPAGTQALVYTEGAPSDFESSEGLAQLAEAISDFEGEGYTVGISLVDLPSGRTLRYRADTDYYAASSIKAPYVISGYELLVDGGSVSSASVDRLARRALTESDNDAYVELRDVFGTEAFEGWLADAGVTPGVYQSLAELAAIHYPHLSPQQELAMWAHAYPYLSGGSASAQKLVSYLAARDVSPIKSALGSSYDTWSKAGWIDFSAEGGVEPATWDSGIVFATSGTYVVAVGSDAPSNLDALEGLIPAIDAAHDALVR